MGTGRMEQRVLQCVVPVECYTEFLNVRYRLNGNRSISV